MSPPSVIDALAMRRALGKFATGVTVVTAVTADGAPAGCTVSAFSALSLRPPLVLACIGRDRHMHDVLAAGPAFAVSILSSAQAGLALRFAGAAADRFAGVASRPGRHGIALLDGAVAHLQCRRHSLLPGGDHSIVVGEVQDIAVTDGEPLLYAEGAFINVGRGAWDRALADASPEWLLSAPW